MGNGISALGLRRTLLLRPTMLDVEARLGSGDEDTEAAGVLRTATIWFDDSEVLFTVLRAEGDRRTILGKGMQTTGAEGRYIGLRMSQVM